MVHQSYSNNIHQKEVDVQAQQWVKAPYKYRYIQRVLAIMALTLALSLSATFMAGIYFALRYQPEQIYKDLVYRNMIRYTYQLLYQPVVKAPLPSLEQELSSAALQALQKLRRQETEKVQEETTDAQTSTGGEAFTSEVTKSEASGSENSTRVTEEVLEKGPSYVSPTGSFYPLYNEKEAQKKPEETYLLPGYEKYKGIEALRFFDKEKQAPLFQVEGIRTQVAKTYHMQPSSLAQQFSLPYPFVIFLYYTQGLQATLGTPYIDANAPFLVLSNDQNLATSLFDVETGSFFYQQWINQFNVVYNFDAEMLNIDSEYTGVNLEVSTQALLPEKLKVYFSPILQAYTKNAIEMQGRGVNMLVAMKVAGNAIEQIDPRPSISREELLKNPSLILQSGYNAISLAKVLNSFIPYLLLAFFLCIFLYLLVLLRLCSFAGYIANRHGEMPEHALRSQLFHFSPLDYLPLEVLTLLMLSPLYFILTGELGGVYKLFGFFFFLWCASFFLLSMIRRHRGGVLFKYTLGYFLIYLFKRLSVNWKWTLAYTALLILLYSLILQGMFFTLMVLIGILTFSSLVYTLDLQNLRNHLIYLLGRKSKLGRKKALPGPFLKSIYQDLDEIESMLNTSLMSQMKSEKFKTELITNVSHDLKTPLTSIVNYAGLLKKGDASKEEAKDYIDRIYQNSMRLQTLTEDLLEASKAASGVLPCEMMKLDLNEFLKQICGEFTDRFQQANLTLHYRVYDQNGKFSTEIFNDAHEAFSGQESVSKQDPEALRLLVQPFYVDADPNHLARIFENLLGNCLKYSIKGSRVFVNVKPLAEEEIVERKEAKVKKNRSVASQDGFTACGLKVEVINISNQEINMNTDQLIERFVQGDSSRKQEGSGLGLSIVKSLADMMHIHFSIRLEEDSFRVSLVFSASCLEEQEVM